MTRLLDNNNMDVETIDSIKEDVELYIECNGDEDFYVDLDCYEVLDLENIEGVRCHVNAGPEAAVPLPVLV